MFNIIFVTSNKGKLLSAQNQLKDLVNLEYCNIDIKELNVNDIDYIAEYKVKEAYKIVNKPCIALDAGFYIINYPGNPLFPGAYPRRELLEKIGIKGLLKKMENIEDRSCYFKECLAYFDGKILKKFYGISYGSLSKEIKGIDTENKWSELWYIFIPQNCTKTLAEMNDIER